jgi:hypothetical protein
MNIHRMLKTRGVAPFELSEEEFEKYYASLYDVLGSDESPEKLRHICNAAICMYQLRLTGYDTPL